MIFDKHLDYDYMVDQSHYCYKCGIAIENTNTAFCKDCE